MPFKSAILRLDGERVKAMLSDDGLVVIGAQGKLRLFDPPRHVCHGKPNGCACDQCVPKPLPGRKWAKMAQSKTKYPTVSTLAKRCECLKQINNDGSCLSCGKPIVDAKSLRFAA